MSFRGISGYCRMAGEKGKEKPLLILSGSFLVEIHGFRHIRHCPYRRHRLTCRAAGTLQRIRKNCWQSLFSGLLRNKQLPGLHSRESRQLCLLQNRYMDQEHSHICNSCCNIYNNRCSGMEKRPYILQYNMPCGYNPGLFLQILMVQANN